MSDAEDPIPQSDLPIRFAMGVLMIGVALVATTFGGWWFRALVAVAAGLMIVEWSDMHRVPRLWAWVTAALTVATLIGAAEYLYAVAEQVDEVPDDLTGALFAPNRIGFAAFVAPALIAALLARRIVVGWGVLYIGVPAFALLSLSWVWETIVLWVFFVTWATDILAYFAGRAIGGPKLAPRISPNKTWAGLIGGMIGAGLVGYATATWFEMEPLFLWLGAPLGAIAQAGDLYESWEKRRAGIKDSGRMLPGHGGVLDRLDGLLAAALATTLILMAGFWTA
ncbi:MAG: phosphatidate cytidylyltransferase [Sphingomonas sp.]